MPANEFAWKLVPHGADTIIELSGDVNRSAQEGLEAAYAEVATAGRILLDFARVDYINSTGIALIVGLLARARADGRAVGAFGLSAHYRELFQITRLSDFMDIYEDEVAATATGQEEPV